MRRILLLSLLAVLALPAAALAAPAKIGPKATAVTPSGATTIEVANPNAYGLRGKATVAAAGRTVATRTVRLLKRSVATVTLRLDAAAIDALRAAGGRATITLKLIGRGRKSTARRTLTLSLPAGGPEQPADHGSHGPAKQEQPASNRWVARMGDEGGYDDFEFTLVNGQMEMTKPTFVPVSCMEMGGYNRIAGSLELFDAPGPWTIGTNGLVAKQGIATNTLVNGGEKTINYKVENTTQAPGKVTGTLGMSFSDSKLDIFNNYRIIFINCAGSQSFEAIPAG
jgi:hypothetical protein